MVTVQYNFQQPIPGKSSTFCGVKLEEKVLSIDIKQKIIGPYKFLKFYFLNTVYRLH